jgi:purine-binding chemotaxis protein CheW
MEFQVVVFNLGAEQFGVSISSVENIVKMQHITRMPQTPHFVEGVTNLRGKIIPVIDLRKRFNLTSEEVTRDTRIIVYNVNNTEVGMVVDGVSEVLTIADSMIEPPPALVSSIDTSFITGIAKVDDRLIILLDMNKALSVEEMTSLQAIAA